MMDNSNMWSTNSLGIPIPSPALFSDEMIQFYEISIYNSPDNSVAKVIMVDDKVKPYEEERKMDSDSREVRCVKLRGLPWSATKDDITDFFNDCKIHTGNDGIHLCSGPNGRATGEGFVEVPPDDDIDVFLRKNKKSMGHRYIEVFKVKHSEMEWAIRRSKDDGYGDSRGVSDNDSDEDSQCFVRLRGLPYECTEDDITDFFKGLEIASNGIQIMTGRDGRPSGEAYVEFSTKEQADRGRAKDREQIGPRYIETFRVGPSELKNMRDSVARGETVGRGSSSNSRHHPYDRGDRGSSTSRSRYSSKGFEDDSWYGRSGNTRSNWGKPPLPFSVGYRSGGSSRSGGSGGRYNSGSYGSGTIGNGEKNCILMRGVPFKSDEYDIRRFFDPLTPTAVDIIYESSGRPSGTAKVLFANGDDCTRAMGKHKERMEHRYIELFLHNT